MIFAVSDMSAIYSKRTCFMQQYAKCLDLFNGAFSEQMFNSNFPMTLQSVLLASVVTISVHASSTLRDCEDCPEMVIVPAGVFQMGNLSGNGLENENPPREVSIDSPFAVSISEITYAEWDACVKDEGCTHVPSDDNWGRCKRAVGYVSWLDANEFVEWISEKSGHRYRLLSEAEWEYMARAGTSKEYPWGDEFEKGKAVCLSCGVGSVMTIEVSQLPPNGFGIYDTVGSQKEWVQDCWNNDHESAPANSVARTDGDCNRRVVKGGSWYDTARFIRSASRAGPPIKSREDVIGFRVARDLQ